MDPKHLATQAALKKLFGQNYFDICTVDKLCKMNAVVIPGEIYRVMSTCHCVDYKEMDHRLRTWLFDECLKAFSQPGLDMRAIDEMRQPVPSATVVDAEYQEMPREQLAARVKKALSW